ncbi:MAG: MFS transporter, partial [Sciscionella sp.]|nr:MFS transporter [Sciscionella sp.]
MLGVLRHRDFTLVWLAGLISETGDWLLITGLPVYVFTLTGSSLVMSTVFIAELIPNVVLGPLAGVLVDRVDRRGLLVIVLLMQSALLLCLFAVSSAGDLWLIYLVAVGESVLTQFVEPAKNALLPSLVGEHEVVAANGLIGLGENIARLVGSSLGGLAVVGGTLVGVTAGDTMSFVVAALLVASTAGRVIDATTDGGHASMCQEFVDGLRVVGRSAPLRATFVSVAFGALAQGLFVVLFVVFVARVLHGDATEIGLLRGVQAIG